MKSNTVKEVFAEDERRPGEARGLAHPIDVEFIGGRIDGEEVAELREQECHCPVCLEVVKPNLRGKHRHHTYVGVKLPEDAVLEEDSDFRRRLDEAAMEIDGNEVIVHGCTPEFIRRKQDIGCLGIVSLGQGLYDAIFPKECVFALM